MGLYIIDEGGACTVFGERRLRRLSSIARSLGAFDECEWAVAGERG